jgi:antitoxin CptB
MRELDVLLTRYLEQRYPQAPGKEQAVFRRLLEWPDPMLYACLMGREPAPDEEARELLARIRAWD